MPYVRIKENGKETGSRSGGLRYWRNAFYGLPPSYDPGCDAATPATTKAFWRAFDRARKAAAHV